MSFDCPAFFGGSPENLLKSSRYRYVPSIHRGNQKKIGPLKERSHLLPAPNSCSPVSSLCGADSPITLSQLITPSAEILYITACCDEVDPCSILDSCMPIPKTS